MLWRALLRNPLLRKPVLHRALNLAILWLSFGNSHLSSLDDVCELESFALHEEQCLEMPQVRNELEAERLSLNLGPHNVSKQ